ncbi:hypothetical protein MRX96_001276 [Rhipicephalus microplus]
MAHDLKLTQGLAWLTRFFCCRLKGTLKDAAVLTPEETAMQAPALAKSRNVRESAGKRRIAEEVVFMVDGQAVSTMAGVQSSITNSVMRPPCS